MRKDQRRANGVDRELICHRDWINRSDRFLRGRAIHAQRAGGNNHSVKGAIQAFQMIRNTLDIRNVQTVN